MIRRARLRVRAAAQRERMLIAWAYRYYGILRLDGDGRDGRGRRPHAPHGA